MQTIGIIAEFNPFHTGHKYLIDMAKKLTGAENCIVIMSGSFVQRGEPAILDKWTRTKCALLNGADIVLELPVIYSTASAPCFAEAAVNLLHSTGLIDFLCFGSESGDIHSLQECAGFQETPGFRHALKERLALGYSYPAAREYAVHTACPHSALDISLPNNILAIEYIRALHKLNSPIRPITIVRAGAYHDTSRKNLFASATALRDGILSGKTNEIYNYLPQNTIQLIEQALHSGCSSLTLEQFTPALNYILRMQTSESLREIFEVTEGLENRILHSIEYEYSIEQIAQYIKSKRYTLAKVKRILLHILLHIKQTDADAFRLSSPYLRVLGFRREKQDLLSQLHHKSSLPIVTQMKNTTHLEKNPLAKKMLTLENRATDLYFMASSNPACQKPKQDYTTSMVMISSGQA